MERVLEIIATLTSGIFAGAAVYINLVEHPARMQCGTMLAATEFGPSYRRAARMQAPLAAIAFVTAAARWLLGAGAWWLVGGICIGLAVPYTLILIMPINNHLLRPDLDRESDATLHLLTKWNQLHAVRSLLGFIAFLIFVVLPAR